MQSRTNLKRDLPILTPNISDVKRMISDFCTHQVCGVLEGVVQVGDPSSVPEHEDVPLLLEAGRLRPLQHLPLVQDLQGEHLVRVLHLDDTYLPERSSPDHFQDLKVFFAQP